MTEAQIVCRFKMLQILKCCHSLVCSLRKSQQTAQFTLSYTRTRTVSRKQNIHYSRSFVYLANELHRNDFITKQLLWKFSCHELSSLTRHSVLLAFAWCGWWRIYANIHSISLSQTFVLRHFLFLLFLHHNLHDSTIFRFSPLKRYPTLIN